MPKRDDTKRTDKGAPLPDLNKETIKDLDVEQSDADKVKAGAIGALRTTSRTC
jgi:hypothetical protein